MASSQMTSASLPPFLNKLRLLTSNTPESVSFWLNDSIYLIINPETFSNLLRKYFKGNQHTFIRQLHFYGFKKLSPSQLSSYLNSSHLTLSDNPSQLWAFEHEQKLFLKNDPQNQLAKKIKRKTKTDPEKEQLAGAGEVQVLRSQVDFLQSTVEQLQMKLELASELIKKAKEGTSLAEESPEIGIGFKKLKRKCSKDSFGRICDEFEVVKTELNLEEEETDFKEEKESMFIFKQETEGISPSFDLDLDLGPFDEEYLNMGLLEKELEQEPELLAPEEILAEISQETGVEEMKIKKIIKYLSKLYLNPRRKSEEKNEVNNMDKYINKRYLVKEILS